MALMQTAKVGCGQGVLVHLWDGRCSLPFSGRMVVFSQSSRWFHLSSIGRRFSPYLSAPSFAAIAGESELVVFGTPAAGTVSRPCVSSPTSDLSLRYGN